MNKLLQVLLISSGIFIVTVTAQINLALEGRVSQHTTLTVNEVSYSADKAIKGPASTNWDNGCSSTATGQRTAWWGIILPKLAFISDIKIWYRSGKGSTMDGFRLYFTNDSDVDGDKVLCYKESERDVPGVTQEITCNILARRFYFFNRRHDTTALVELCYIEIYGCWRGFWGADCTQSCPVECVNHDCYPGNGSCVWGCDLNRCFHGTCDNDSGVCTRGCKNGRAGRYCNHYNLAINGIAKQNPTDQSFPARRSIDGDILTCISLVSTDSYLQVDTGFLSVVTFVYISLHNLKSYVGNFTLRCSNTTDYLTDGKVIHTGEHINKNIQVFGICKYIIYIPSILDGISRIDLCEIEIVGCPFGKYGDDCELSCSKNCAGPCDLVTGNCMFGCFDGWIGVHCKQGCDLGFYGSQCLRNCSTRCLSKPCNHVTGECHGGCQKGWTGFNCTTECESGKFGWNCLETCDGCKANACDHINGICSDTSGCKPGFLFGIYCNKTCEDWHFGRNCSKTCNCRYQPCEKSSGKCSTEGCQRGWHGDSCDEECNPGHFGFSCIGFCKGCYNTSCDIYEGNCTYGCVEGYSGPICSVQEFQEQPQTDPGPAIAGGISAVIIVILLVVVGIIIYRRRLRSIQKRYANDKKHIQSNENPYMNQERNDEYVNVGCVANATDFTVSVHERASRMSDAIPIEDDVEDEGNVYNNVPSKISIVEYKIAIGDLKHVIEEKQKNESFKEEYEILPKGLIHPHMEGSKDENKIKNRFLTTWPYDHSRVVLVGNTKHDYINASYIDSYDKEKAYIASQGPQKNTVRDFWHMVWQEKTGKIVMVTQLQEERRRKCEQYWPQEINRPMVVDQYKLTMREETIYTIYVYRLLVLQNKKNQKERRVHHFHFTQWPDHGVPDSIKLVHFYRKVKHENRDQSGPMVVHCSAGVGRTGTFIAIDAFYEHGKKAGYVDVMNYVQMMRKDRMNMIQTHEQYKAVFDALLELFTVPETAIQKNNFCVPIEKQENRTLPKNQTMYKEEFQRLQSMRPLYSAKEYTAASSKENTSKNSQKNVLAHDQYRPYLISYGINRNDYINAVIISGFSADSKFFVTQYPLLETVVDFWTMIYDHRSEIIVLLDPVNEDAPLWLEKKEMLEFDNFSIYQEREKTIDELHFILNHKRKRSISVFTVDDWTINSDVPPSPECMLDLIQHVVNCWEKQKCPITVVCRDGCRKSGLFVALRLVLEKLQIDDEVDIFQVVRTIQIRRPEFILEYDQYEYCYKCIKVLLEKDSQDTLYANA
ncbi:Tyrosine-protein phosphatase non-receptor type 5,Receptor-type tyrosine-protein phosphatase R,Receptor-type tyrosine-protein phosphatase S,Receptor-type tyrosine-protein phosphatase eta,Tyrosine-protein phosphatase non-receptor type 7,Receptor-type tyrosine-protein phosphatase N2,Tyrosine-protein phosphatase non-receptor type 12,Receptor-type tyrosine-protein phosphatase delta [Mytilus coruscus]|uniref:protein-tyrosine-phosphatase n=1 Tax=Mytilus coruscus TaxID=42192 RepID=A0A6J8EPL5_MYTCO|nr:Tyrosine-protein phosphatase non-receptor type 5,Receptor-type tyrosine-protein phosphatase R,Receptor-type tyrosine-protein phosphatase S,Receptor-type tyrosine-protein phosphatase eta,Tyrosine-protein phosphatase non-receptor type 7,Receptor-type tyrosine-protein phosphatase N2,Tyrosine-protein phosphatase non-receptor type 12,Receptor-type tyrosine-protein phosphatase delta [Mytilus coruscus]